MNDDGYLPLRWGLFLAPLILAGCTKGILCPDKEGWSCVKNYCIVGNASIGGNAPAVSGDVMGQIWSHGIVIRGDVHPAVQMKALERGCDGERVWPDKE